MFDFKKFNDSRPSAGYQSMTLVKEQGEEKYSLLMPSETVPCPVGSQDSFEFDILQSGSKGKVKGKSTIDDKEVEFLLHRDNIYRLNQLVGKTLDFMYVSPDLMGLKYTGTITYRPNDLSADIAKGTYTLTCFSADQTFTVFDVRPYYKDTVYFSDVVPANVKVGEEAVSFNVVTDPMDGVTIECVCDNENFEVTPTQATGTAPAKVSIAKKSLEPADAPQYGMLYITAKKEGFAPWTTTVALEY